MCFTQDEINEAQQELCDEAVTAFIKTHGVACGGNWAAMLMSAIKSGLPEVYKNLEDRSYSFEELCEIIEANI